MAVAIIYGSSMGNTEKVANLMKEKLNVDADVFDIANIDASTFSNYDKIICGIPTWNSGEMQDDWADFDFESLDLNGKTIALFGLGDVEGYGDTFGDAMGELYEIFKEKGASFIGSVSCDEYEFEGSTAVVDDKFVGLMLDYDNDDDEKNETRIDAWLDSIKGDLE